MIANLFDYTETISSDESASNAFNRSRNSRASPLGEMRVRGRGVVVTDNQLPLSEQQGVRYVFRPWRRDPRTGAKIWAKTYGLKAWRIPVSEGDDKA